MTSVRCEALPMPRKSIAPGTWGRVRGRGRVRVRVRVRARVRVGVRVRDRVKG